MLEYTHKDEILKSYQCRYENILNMFYPSKGSTGFTERNLSVNFSKAYEEIALKYHEQCCSWFELPIDIGGHDHMDAIIINSTLREILMIEAKRYSDPSRKVSEVIDDVERMCNTDWLHELTEERSGSGDRYGLQDIGSYKMFGVVLADLWLESDRKRSIRDLYAKAHDEDMLSTDFFSQLRRSRKKQPTDNFPELRNFCVDNPIDINTERNVSADYVREEYKLVSFSWVLSIPKRMVTDEAAL